MAFFTGYPSSLLAFHPGFHPDIAREKSRIGR